MFKGLFDFYKYEIKINWLILGPILLFVLFGLITLSSTSDLSRINSPFYKQCIWFFLGIIAFIFTQYVRIQFLYDYGYIFYIIIILLISITLTPLTPVIEGSKRWIVLGSIYLQPSEFGKIFYIISISRLFSDYKNKDKFSFYLILILILSLLPSLLIIKQPDLGTALAYLSIVLPILYFSKIKLYIIFFLVSPLVSIFATYNIWWYYIWMICFLVVIYFSRPKLYVGILNFILNLLCAISAPYIWNNFLHEHQRQRILTFINPLSDPLGAGYQVIQSMISIGSGGFLGKGLGNGTQTHLKFLPVRDSDFIISVMGEELGFMAIATIIFSLCFFVYWCFIYAQKIENNFISTLVVACCSLIYMHMIINIGMISGLLPVTGLPAPFISYGGSFFLTSSVIVGLINNAINNHI